MAIHLESMVDGLTSFRKKMKRRIYENTSTFGHNDTDPLRKVLTKDSFIDTNASLSILSFKTGSLHADFPDCIKTPGIYGSVFEPVELLDRLHIRNGVNAYCVRFAAQFGLDQQSLDRLISSGFTISLTPGLTFSFQDHH